MSEWEPATEAEVAMRDALRANDQEQYFRILARTDVLLPIAPDSSPGSDGGWGTWTTEGRTHVLAFTSPSALQECLAGHPGTHRRVPFRELAGIWPNVEWWLAVNPGLPIEGYLPSWFVTQISRGDVRLPGRTLGARARMEQASQRTRATAQVPVRPVPNQPAPTPIERQRMKAEQPPVPPVPPAPPRREVPMPDVAPPGAFLPTRADRPINFERSAGRSFTPPPAAPARPAPPPPADNGPTLPAPTSGAGSVRGRASFPGAAPRGLFDDSDRKSLDVPGERELFSGVDRPASGPPAERPPSILPGRPTGRPSRALSDPGPPMRPAADPGLPQRPVGDSGLPQRPSGDSGLPQRPVSDSGLPQRPSGDSGLPQRPVSDSGLPSRPAGGGDEGGDPRRYWPRREPARSLGEIYTEHAEPVIPAAWQPPPDLPLTSGPPLPTRQPQTSRPEADSQPTFRPGGTLPQRPGSGSGTGPRSGEPLPPRPVQGEPLPSRPLSGEVLPPRPGAVDTGSYRSGSYRSGDPLPSRPVPAEPAPYPPAEPVVPREATQPIRSGWSGSADVRPGRPGLAAHGGGEAFQPAEPPNGGQSWSQAASAAPTPVPPAPDPDPSAPLPFDRPVFDRPGFSRLDVESPEADEPSSESFGDTSSAARSAGFGRAADLDEHPFFGGGSDAGGRSLFEPSSHPQQPPAEPARPESGQTSWADSAWANSQPAEQPFSAWGTPSPAEPAVDEAPGTFFSGRAEVQPPAAEPQRSFFGDQPAREDEQRPFFEEVAEPRPFNAFGESRAEDPPIRDPYAALADLRSEPEDEPSQASFASGLPSLAEQPPTIDSTPAPRPESTWTDTRPAAGGPSGFEKENTGSFFLPGPARDAESVPVAAEPSPELRSFFEDGEAERPDFQQSVVQDLPKFDDHSAAPPSEAASASGFRPVMQDALPSTGQGYQGGGEAGQDGGFSWAYQEEAPQPPESVVEPEIVEDAPVRLHDEIVDAEVVTPPSAPAPVAESAPEPERPKAPAADFHPANTVEKDLFEAVQANSTDRFLSTLLLAKVLIPFWTGDGPVEPAKWRTEHMNGLPHLVVFTSQERMTERLGEDARGSWIKFTRLIRQWPPGDQLAFAINPESPAGAVLPGTEVIQLASWATEMGLGVDDPDEQPVAAAPKPEAQPEKRPAYEPPGSGLEQVMQKPISPEQLSYYLERNYDRVSGFVHRAGEVGHLETPEQLYNALGLGYAGSSFKPDAEEAYVLRWIAYRGDLYRIPYGGSSFEAMRAMEGWVIERPPFRGNGFAPSETGDVIAEFKVDSARLPHNAELWRLRRDGRQDLIARLDADGPAWRKATP
ncbi:SseB family protein [Dactylosporangium sp. CA-139114]|uniref:SseB family protein n=1 Tax=Dactylosporangium sp. CA-139114 TaxID=3239931 RepID=UPI003D951942